MTNEQSTRFRTKPGIQEFNATQFCRLNISIDNKFRFNAHNSPYDVKFEAAGNPYIEILSEMGGTVVVNEGDWLICCFSIYERVSPMLFANLFEPAAPNIKTLIP